MYYIYDKIILSKAINKWGCHLQTIVAIEELAELQKELTKALRDKPNRKKITEEIGDVEIMIEQLKIIFNINDADLIEAKEGKFDRLRGLLK